MLNIRHIKTLDELEALKPTWDNLANKEYYTVFQSWDWNFEWCKQALPENKSAALNIMLLEDSQGNEVGIIPLYRENVFRPIAKINQFLGNHISCQNDIIMSEYDNPELAEEIISSLQNNLRTNNFIFLKHLDGNSGFTKQLAKSTLASPQYQRIVIRHNPEIKDQKLRFGKSTRKNFRWRENKLKRDYDVDITVKTGNESAEAVDKLIELHLKRFKSTNRESSFTESSTTFLKNYAVNNCKKVELIELSANGKVIASEYAINDNNQYFFMVGGFDPEFDSFSPLKILMTECMQRAFDVLGCTLCDLGPGYEKYKYDWNPETITNYYAAISGNDLYSKIITNSYRNMFKKKLPPQ